MDDFFFWMIVIVFISTVAPIAFWVLFAVGIFKLVSNAGRQFEKELADNERRLRQLANSPYTGNQAVSQAQLMNRLMTMNSHYRALQDLDRQRYDLRMGELSSMAAQAGIDWKPPSY